MPCQNKIIHEPTNIKRPNKKKTKFTNKQKQKKTIITKK